jgi:hypothetical protein
MFFFDTTGFLMKGITEITPVICRCTLECIMIVIKDELGNPIAQVPFMGDEEQEENLLLNSGIIKKDDKIDFFNPIPPGVNIQPLGLFYDLIKNQKAADQIKENIKKMGLNLVSIYVRELGKSKNDPGAYKTALIPYTSDVSKFLSFCPIIHGVNYSSNRSAWKAGLGVDWSSINPEIEMNNVLQKDNLSFKIMLDRLSQNEGFTPIQSNAKSC